jgi:hypothetical protein
MSKFMLSTYVRVQFGYQNSFVDYIHLYMYMYMYSLGIKIVLLTRYIHTCTV